MNKRINLTKRVSTIALALTLLLTAVIAATPTKALAASKSVTVSTQAQLNKALKNSKYKKITIENTADTSYKIAKGTYHAALILSAKEGCSLSLDIANGAAISQGLTIKGANADIQVTSAAKIAITAKAASVIRLYAGAEGSTIKKTVKKGIFVGNYTDGTIQVTEKSGASATVEKAIPFDRNISVRVDGITGTTIYIEDAESSKIYKNGLFFVDGKDITSAIYCKDSTGYNWCRVTVGETFSDGLSEGAHTFTMEIPGYEPYTVEITYKKTVTGVLTQKPWAADKRIYVKMIPQLSTLDVTYTLDGVEVTPYNSFLNGDNVFTVWIKDDGLSKGTHTLVVSAEGYDPETITFTK